MLLCVPVCISHYFAERFVVALIEKPYMTLKCAFMCLFKVKKTIYRALISNISIKTGDSHPQMSE